MAVRCLWVVAVAGVVLVPVPAMGWWPGLLLQFLTGRHMSDSVANLAAAAVQGGQQPARAQGAECTAIRQLFMLFHGAYGDQFLGKFSTGELDANGKDKGVRSAMQVWQAYLADFTPDVVFQAAKRAQEAHPKFPPNLPEFVVFCRAAMPRVAYVDPDANVARLPAPVRVEAGPVEFVAMRDGKDWARKILAELAAGARRPHGVVAMAKAALGGVVA